MDHREQAKPVLDFQFGRSKPDGFNATDWTTVKRAGKIVAAQHVSGAVRKMPAAWLEANPAPSPAALE